MKFLEKKKNFLVFCGNPGIGKTYFCAAFVEWAIRKFSSFRYWHEDKLLQRVRQSIASGTTDFFKELEFLTDDDLLMIDDLGCNKPNEWREEIMFHLLDTRYNSGKATIFTSNLTREEFKDRYHHRIYSRLFAQENIIIEIHDGADLRMEGQ